ncbi:hypothetical protein H632_c1013p1 [Helicosporidium sp. ATCC 50920]|nr:hypothetical protein H632_c1013p1 [Helicosporidium sp. ATCC 50920]|eukprot:KDD74881.1 hypothetical protein H632_c1013p1 [Helicosporidium sp. ATCC 50920]
MVGMSSDARASGGLPTISVQDAEKALREGTHRLLDVRTPAEFRVGHIEHAINIPFFLPDDDGNPCKENHMFLETAFKFFPNKSHPIIATCMSMSRVKLAAAELAKGNYDGVKILEGGMRAWHDSGRYMIQESRLQALSKP